MSDMAGRRVNNEFLGTEPVRGLLFRLAIPTVAAQLINMLYNVVDRIYIGHMPGEGDLALTGVGVCLPVILIVSAFAALVGSGGGPRASIAMGRKAYGEAERIMGSCLAFLVMGSVVLTAVLLLWGEKLLLIFGASENTIGYAWSYMSIYALGTVFVQVTLGMNPFITGQGFSRMGMMTVLIGAGLNIALDPLFIFGFGMGVRGAAVATIISQEVSCIWVLCFLRGKKTVLRLKKENIRMDLRIVGPCVALGVAPFIMQASESVIAVCFNASLLKYGGDVAVGAMTILTSVMQFAMMPLQGLAQGAQPIISYNYGAGDGKRVRETYRLLLAVSLSYSFVLWGLVQLFPGVFAGIFTSDAVLRPFAADALRIYCAVLCIFGLQVACQMTFVSLGKAGASVLVAVMRKFVLLLPLIYIMPAIMEDQTVAVYTAEPVADLLAVSFTGILFFFQFRKTMQEIE